MGALAAGTSVRQKFFCQCVLEDGNEAFIVIKATSEAMASEMVHEGYNVEYVLDILTALQMEYRKRHLRRSIIGSMSNI